MKKIFLSAMMAVACMSVSAQDTYQSAAIADKDLNGTARYVGMGGAMEALGADISTMNSNPAGIGMFRKSQAAVSFGLQSVTGNDVDMLDASKTKMSFDQIGAVVSVKTGYDTYLNFGFNYNKSKNFNQLLNAANSLSLASQNKLSFIKEELGVFGEYNYSQADYLYDYVLNGIVDDKGEMVEPFYEYYNADGFMKQQVQEGYIGDYDFNFSGNIHNRLYLGLTIGIKDVNYHSSSVYSESLLAADDKTRLGTVDLVDSRNISGTGVNLKFGAIVRPVATSAFRVGAYVHTPTWYSLTTSNFTTLYNNLPEQCGNYDSMNSSESLKFKLNTPWLFGLSLGHTVGQTLALGATYEYSDYDNLDNRVIDGEYYDYYYGSYHESSSSDHRMNKNTEHCLRGVHTIKVGAEMKVAPEVALRLGYNYVSPKYSEDGYLDGTIESQGTYYASQTDYTNWKSTNRITAGIGYAKGNFFADLAYKYSQTDGEYFPFMSYYSDDELNNVCDVTNVSDKRHQVLLTLGYKF